MAFTSVTDPATGKETIIQNTPGQSNLPTGEPGQPGFDPNFDGRANDPAVGAFTDPEGNSFWTLGQVRSLTHRIRTMRDAGVITAERAGELETTVFSGTTPFEAISQLDSEQAIFDARQEATSRESEGLAAVDSLRQELLGSADDGTGLLGQQAKLQGFIDDPNSVRSDPILSQRLAQTEAALDNQLGQIRDSSARSLAAGGLRASGKAGGNLRAAQQQSGFLKGQNFSSLLGDIESAKQGLAGQISDTQLGLSAQEQQVKSGFLPNLAGLKQLGQADADLFSNLGATSSDFTGLRLAKQNNDFSNFLQFLGLAQAGINNQSQQFTGLLSQGGPFGRNG